MQNTIFLFCSFPKEHPFNRDGYRYILAEADPHAPFRQVKKYKNKTNENREKIK
jgi:hypothetical protein